MEFWNSQPQCFGGRLPPDVDVERNRFWLGSTESSWEEPRKQEKAQPCPIQWYQLQCLRTVSKTKHLASTGRQLRLQKLSQLAGNQKVLKIRLAKALRILRKQSQLQFTVLGERESREVMEEKEEIWVEKLKQHQALRQWRA
jgi:hypothetical protein